MATDQPAEPVYGKGFLQSPTAIPATIPNKVK